MGYYIHSFLPGDVQAILDGPRITYISKEAYLRSGFQPGEYITLQEGGEGPYLDLKTLKRQSIIYHTLLKEDKKRAALIIKREWIVESFYLPNFPDIDEDYGLMVFKIFTHSLHGETTKKGVKGLHIYDNRFMEITKVIRYDYNTNIFEANVIGINKVSGLRKAKEHPSTFFPTKWPLNRLIRELYTAYYKRIQMNEGVYCGRTATGILVEFIFNAEGNLKTVYPIFE